MGFLAKTVNGSMTVGEQLSARREALGFTQEAAGQAVGLQMKQIVMLEDGRYDSLPGIIYIRQYLRQYNNILGFDAKELLAQAEQEYSLILKGEETRRFNQPAASHLIRRRPLVILVRQITPWLAGATLIAVVAVSLLRFFDPPSVEITNPVDGLVLSAAAIEVTGRTSEESAVSINGQTVVKAADGTFQETVELKTGMNTLVIKAQKKRGWPRVIERRVLVE